SIAIGWIVKLLDTPTQALLDQGIHHAIGYTYPAPQATLMATLAKGILSFNLDWQYVIAGVFISVTLELCGVTALAFAIGLYLPLSTTLARVMGGAVKGIVNWRTRNAKQEEESELSRGNLLATGLVAGGALTGVIVAILYVLLEDTMVSLSAEHALTEALGQGGYYVIGTLCFGAMATYLYRVSMKK